MEIFPFSPRFLLCSFENKNAMFQSGQDSDLSRLVAVKGETERKGQIPEIFVTVLTIWKTRDPEILLLDIPPKYSTY